MSAYLFRFWIVLILCALPSALQAGGDLDRAVELTLEMKYPEALKLANKALRSSASGPGELAKAYEIQGMCLASLGKTRAAVQSFRRLLAIDPAFRFGENISPKIAEPFDQALKESKDQKKISLTHSAPGAEVARDKLALKVALEADPLSMVKKIRMRYQIDGGKKKAKTRRIKKPGLVAMKFPKKLEAKEISYWFEAQNRHGGVLARAGKEKEPFTVKIRPPKPPVVAVSPVVKKKLEPEPPVPLPPVIPPEEPGTEEDDGGAWYEQWWLWTGVGVLVTGAVVAAVLASDLGEPGGQLEYDVFIR